MKNFRSDDNGAYLVLGIGALIAALFVADIWDDRHARVEAGNMMAGMMAGVAADNLTTRLDSLNQILTETAALFPSMDVPDDVLEPMRARVLADRDIRALSFVDPEGILRQIVHKQLTAPKLPLDVSDRSHYQRQRLRHERNEIAVSPPAIDKLTRRPAWFMSRPIHDDGGRFIGLATLVLEQDIFNRALAGFPKDVKLTAGIFSDDGSMFAAIGENEILGQSASASPVFSLWTDKAAPTSLSGLPGMPPDQTFLTAGAAMPNYPFGVYVGLSQEEWTAEWRHETWTHMVGLAAILAALFWTAFTLRARNTALKTFESAQSRSHQQLLGHLSEQVEQRTLELKKSLTALGESEERFRLFADIAPLPLIVTRRSDGVVVYINARAADTFQVPQDKAHGKIAPDFWKNPTDRARMVELLSKGVPVRDLEAVLRRADGSEFTALLSAAIGQLQGETMILVSLLDISDRKRLEQELARSNADLEQFSYAASHDLQEPLRMVAAYVGLIERRYADLLDDEGREFVSFAVQGALRMSRLINDLLEYSRIHNHEWELIDTDLRLCLDEARSNLETAIRDSGAIVEHTHLPIVSAEPLQIMRVFQNLIGNSLKYRDPDKVVKINIYADRSHGEWTVSVVDDGQGMTAENCARMFQPFQRFHKHSGIEGTGLGLALCRRIIEAHGGRIWAESDGPGTGLAVRFTLKALS